MKWFQSLGINKEKLRLRPHGDDELAHYSSACYDIEYKFDFGWSELEGIADRGTFDLDQHMNASNKKLTYFDQINNDVDIFSFIYLTLILIFFSSLLTSNETKLFSIL